VVDNFALYFKLVIAGSAFFAVLAAARWSGGTGDAPEYLTLILSVVLGSILLVSMRDLFGVFLAIELATIPPTRWSPSTGGGGRARRAG
jgi:NADH-quinone oxidoreductase subunit N